MQMPMINDTYSLNPWLSYNKNNFSCYSKSALVQIISVYKWKFQKKMVRKKCGEREREGELLKKNKGIEWGEGSEMWEERKWSFNVKLR